MNGLYFLLWLASVLAVFSVPFVFLAIVARLVGRLGSRSLAVVLATDTVLWGIALYFWRVVKTG